MKTKELSKKNKTILKIIIAIIIVAISFVFVLILLNKINSNSVDYIDPNSVYMVKEDEDGYLYNTSTELAKTKNFNNLIFSNIKISNYDNTSVFLADVTNNTGSDIPGQERTLTFFNYLNNEIFKLNIYISEAKNGETVPVRTQTYDFIVDAFNFKLD